MPVQYNLERHKSCAKSGSHQSFSESESHQSLSSSDYRSWHSILANRRLRNNTLLLVFGICHWKTGGPYKQIYSVDPESVRKMFFSSGMKEELYEMRRYISSTVADLRRLGHLLNSREYISVVDFERWFQSSREESRRYILDFMKGNRVNVVAQSNDTLLSYPALTVVYEAPPACVNKLNTDGAFIASGIPGVPGKAAWSGVWRDCENNLGPVYSGKVDGILSSYEAEMCGICYSARASYENSGLRNEPWVW
ncbi:uncharacterized protein LOC132276371 [Cornus florida]|uniref:uncharacterized protein LOC132276371 n=1 Tax=Cornus florida TaxID=4283 RepID=UPI00289B0622|nr:uncharacterized protein LOC132276371 [Cornus florida]XP_059633756.1 uncharacterized protein LOC132276371 [Cornus florida]XP_059633757.1 uncharacterized protein LOC132276371 [Cornus florida]